SVTVTNSIVPDFAAIPPFCSGSSVPALNTTSPNGVTGSWSPSTISNTTSGNYVFTPDAGQCASPVTLSVTVTNSIVPDFAAIPPFCSGSSVPALNATSPNGITGSWSPSTVSNTTSGNYVFTPDAGQCASPVTLSVTVTNSIVPDFAAIPPFCSGSSVPALDATSPNGITGSWSPATVSNTTSGNYVFTPDAGQCASPVTLSVTVTNSIVPDFAAIPPFCSGSSVPALNTTSPNGVTGSWSPTTVSNTTSGNYVFTPDAGQCASPVTLSVTVTNLVMPNFPQLLSFCQTPSVPTLSPISPNGVTGSWNPSAIDPNNSGTYLFTPDAGQCAQSWTLSVTIIPIITPDFASSMTLCSVDPVPTLQTTSPNGISGTWSPSVISTLASDTYVFTPNPGPCANPVTLSVTIMPATMPNFATGLQLCEGDTAPALDTTSPNGISGVWSTSLINNQQSGTYIFTPDTGQCAQNTTLNVIVNPLPDPNLVDGSICVDSNGNTSGYVLDSGISGSGYQFTWTMGGTVVATSGSTYTALQAGTYEVLVTNITTGCYGSDSASVTALSPMTAVADVPGDFSGNRSIVVSATGGSGNYSYQLDDEPVQFNPVLYPVQPGEHTIIVRDVDGCSEVTIDAYLLDYPHFFTPNGDGYSDYWNIKGLSNQAGSIINIFDRYGKLLKVIKPSDSYGWDGTYNGHELPSTDYWFTLDYIDKSGNTKVFKAHFSLKR
ncbi:T9SS type B sorting domain-containing protein, partial [Flavobacterium silvaticum]